MSKRMKNGGHEEGRSEMERPHGPQKKGNDRRYTLVLTNGGGKAHSKPWVDWKKKKKRTD